MDTAVQLTIQNEEQFVKLLGFLHSSNIPFDILTKDSFNAFLFQAIDVEKVNPSWMRRPVFEKQLEEIQDQLELSLLDDVRDGHDITESDEHLANFKEFRKLVNREYTTAGMKTLYKPTDHFKEYCGSEWLNPKGMISPQSVLNFFDFHIRGRNIRVEDGVIYTTEWLRSLLQETRETMFYDELPQYVSRLLKISQSNPS